MSVTISGTDGISNVPAGNIAATTGQGALNELDAEKAALNGNAAQNFAANALTCSSVNGGQLAGFRNAIINGGMQVAQRGTTAAITNASVNYLAIDRYAFYNSNVISSWTVSQVAGSNGFKNFMKLQRTAASTVVNTTYMDYALESSDSIPMQGKIVTLSFYAKAGANFSPTNGTIAAVLYSGTGIDQSTLNMYQGIWTGQSVVASGAANLTTTLTRYSFTTNVLASNVTQLGIQIYMTPVGTAGADDSCYITGLQLEVGSVATPFEHRPYGLELQLCQRYLPSFTFPGLATPVAPGQATGATTGQHILNFPVTVRTPPTGIILSNVTHYGITHVAGYGALITCTALSLGNVTDKAATLSSTVVSGLTAGNYSGLFSNNAAATIYFTGCEL